MKILQSLHFKVHSANGQPTGVCVCQASAQGCYLMLIKEKRIGMLRFTLLNDVFYSVFSSSETRNGAVLYSSRFLHKQI